MPDHTGITVVESRWWDEANTSVRGLFELIADINCGNPHAYGYEMTNCEVAVKEAIPRLGSNKNCKYICLATHGDKDGLYLHNGEKITRTELRNLLKKIKGTRGSNIDGVHMSSCIFATAELSQYIFEQDVAVKWISGYSEAVEFIDSSALDLLFFNELIGNAPKKETINAAIQRTAARLNDIAGGLIEELGFGIYVRKQKTGGAKNLLET